MSDENIERRVIITGAEGDVRHLPPKQGSFVEIKNAVYDEMVRSGFTEEQALKVLAYMLTAKK